ncbi:hypothetical protein BDY19DRAFT_95274 [Irpex rosettiformis]|uniref:Uncharacterized protein n=1 Tax=Irpex rosettiformis TaxID=378272 RepID=A0ACB8U783_9APHY|nr:hypothetical protein BDY19DRAFT_95274 [Irpex rosettiformis]
MQCLTHSNEYSKRPWVLFMIRSTLISRNVSSFCLKILKPNWVSNRFLYNTLTLLFFFCLLFSLDPRGYAINSEGRAGAGTRTKTVESVGDQTLAPQPTPLNYREAVGAFELVRPLSRDLANIGRMGLCGVSLRTKGLSYASLDEGFFLSMLVSRLPVPVFVSQARPATSLLPPQKRLKNLAQALKSRKNLMHSNRTPPSNHSSNRRHLLCFLLTVDIFRHTPPLGSFLLSSLRSLSTKHIFSASSHSRSHFSLSVSPCLVSIHPSIHPVTNTATHTPILSCHRNVIFNHTRTRKHDSPNCTPPSCSRLRSSSSSSSPIRFLVFFKKICL